MDKLTHALSHLPVSLMHCTSVGPGALLRLLPLCAAGAYGLTHDWTAFR